jgi:galactonate dehydratase
VHEVVQTFIPTLIGQDALATERIWQRLWRMGPFRGSVVSGAVSAIDLALWDLKGKHFGVPVWQLLGGKTRDKVRLHLIVGGTTTTELVTNAREAVDLGFTAVKISPLVLGYQDLTFSRLTSSVIETVGAVREAVGDDADIILEFNRRLTPLQAVPLLQALLPFRLLFCEDPIQIDSIRSQGQVAKKVDVAIANGERMHSIWEFRELLETGGAQYVRPDPGIAGGISGCRHIATLAESYHAAMVTHNYLGPLLTAASMHLDLSIPNFVVQEYTLRDETDTPPSIRSTHRRDGGYLIPSEAPGLGVEIAFESFEPQDYVAYMRDFVNQLPMRSDGSLAFSV